MAVSWTNFNLINCWPESVRNFTWKSPEYYLNFSNRSPSHLIWLWFLVQKKKPVAWWEELHWLGKKAADWLAFLKKSAALPVRRVSGRQLVANARTCRTCRVACWWRSGTIERVVNFPTKTSLHAPFNHITIRWADGYKHLQFFQREKCGKSMLCLQLSIAGHHNNNGANSATPRWRPRTSETPVCERTPDVFVQVVISEFSPPRDESLLVLMCRRLCTRTGVKQLPLGLELAAAGRACVIYLPCVHPSEEGGPCLVLCQCLATRYLRWRSLR